MITIHVPNDGKTLAHRLRLSLLAVIAPDCKCAECSGQFPINRLEIDHVDGRDWSGRTVSRLQRAKRYWTEYLAGVALRALCRSCNAIDGTRRQVEKRKAA